MGTLERMEGRFQERLASQYSVVPGNENCLSLLTKNHWIENGPAYAHLSVLVPKALIAALESSWPITMPKLIPDVVIPRSLTGDTYFD